MNHPTTEQRELLGLAAKAAGLVDDWPAPHYEIQWNGNGLWCSGLGNGALWNPLTDDGDAFRLAVKLGLGIERNHPLDNERWVQVSNDEGMNLAAEDFDSDPYDATRLCIVRAAAAIAKGEKA